MSKRENTNSFNVLLTADEYRKLQMLADSHMISKSVVLRRLISIGFGMKIDQVPQCATGEACKVPQMFLTGQGAAVGTSL